MLDFLVLFSVFARQKVTVNENINFADSVSGIWPPDCTKLAKNQENGNDVKIFRQDVIVNFFDVVLFLLSILVTGPGFMARSSLVLELWQFSFKGLTRNTKIGNTSVWVLANVWRLGRVMDTKFGTNVSNRMLLNAAKYQGYSFYRFWVIKGKPTGGRVKLCPFPTHIRVKGLFFRSKLTLY